MALTAMPWGCWKFGKLNAAAAPVCEIPGVKTSIRLFWESQTYRRPDESVAILRGRLRPASVLEVPMEANVCCPTTLDAVGRSQPVWRIARHDCRRRRKPPSGRPGKVPD